MSTIESPRLRTLLTNAARHDAEYGAGLSNHLPMALAALARLGASDERLDSFAAHYARRLHAAPPIEPWPAGDAWRAPLGDPRAWPRYRALFRDWLEHEGAGDVLAQTLPVLMQGVGAAAFHGPIRVAYALAANHADELADALAYWACRWFACEVVPPTALRAGAAAEPQQVLAALDFADELPQAPLISQRMLHAAGHPRFAPALSRLHVRGTSTLALLARLAAERYAASADFTVLHLVTSAHAVAVLLPWLDESDHAAALTHYAHAYAAGWATRPAQGEALPPRVVLPWPEIVARALESDDDHAIKLVDSGREHERAYGGAVWRVAASRAVG
jgi:Questin oxidase-like